MRKIEIRETEISSYKENKMYIGQRIKEARLAKNIKGVDLGAYLNLSDNQISRMECGTANCTIQSLFYICQYLEVSADYILFGNQKQKNEITDEQRKAIDEVLRVFR